MSQKNNIFKTNTNAQSSENIMTNRAPNVVCELYFSYKIIYKLIIGKNILHGGEWKIFF